MKKELTESVFTADTNEPMDELGNDGGTEHPYGDFLRERYRRTGASAKEALRLHLGNSIVFTGTWLEAEERELEEEELMEGEVSASVFTVGCYTVRMAYCLYVDDSDREMKYTERIPAGQDKIIAYRNGERRIGQELEEDEVVITGLCPIGKNVRMVTEVSARYNPSSEPPVYSWRNICMAAPGHGGSESIDYICTVKQNDMVPDGQAALFVLNNYGDGFRSVDCWYKFTPDGMVEQYSTNGCGKTDTTAWEL